MISTTRFNQHERDRHHQGDSLDHRKIAVADRADRQIADTGKRKDVFHHHRPAQQIAELDPQHGDEGNQ